MKPKLPLLLLLPIMGLALPAAAQTTVPLFDSGGSTTIGGDPNPYPYSAAFAPTTGSQTFYFEIGSGNGSSTAPWGGSNQVTALNLSLWAYSGIAGTAAPVTIGLYNGTDTGGGLSGLTEIGSLVNGSINNTSGGVYNNTASTFSFSLTGNTDPITGPDFIVGITVTAGSPLDLAIGAPLGGSPSPTYTFSNAFTGSTGLSANSYLYSGANGSLTTLITQDTNLLPFADLTASITPLPELPPVTYLLLSLPLVLGVLVVRRQARA